LLDVTFGKILLPGYAVVETHHSAWFWNGVLSKCISYDCWINQRAADFLRLFRFVSDERYLWFTEAINVRLTDYEYENRRSLMIHKGKGNFDFRARPIMKRSLLNIEPHWTKPSGSHTHPEAAAERNSMRPYFVRLAMELGRNVFMWSLSNADIKAGIRGNKTTYWPKDLLVPHIQATPKNGDMICLVDVDWYLDMNRFMSMFVHCWCIYGLNPTAPAGTVQNGDFTFVNNKLRYCIAGGAWYEHELWDYNRETIVAHRYEDGEWYAAVYMVEQKALSDHRVVVIMEPIYKATGLAAQLLVQMAENGEQNMGSLRRLRPQPNPEANYNIISSLRRTDDKASNNVVRHYSVSIPGQTVASTITARTYAAMKATVLSSKTPVTASALATHMGNGPDVKQEAELWRLYWQERAKEGEGVEITTYTISNENACKGYAFNPKMSALEEKESKAMRSTCKAVCSPFVGSIAYAAMSCRANDEVGVANRITKMQHKTDLEGSTFLYTVMDEFVSRVVPEDVQHTLEPKSVEDVFKQQNRPSQRSTLMRGDNMGPYARHDIIDTFQKREVYAKIADPRTISQVDPETKLAYSAFYMVVSLLLKSHLWYTFGKTPKEMAERIALIATGADYVVMGDFSRMDATISNLGRRLTTAIMMRAFHPKFHEELQTLLQRQVHRTCWTKFGVNYKSGTSRLSGSPETSGHNTLENAFIAFLALRMTKDEDGEYLKADRAFSILNERMEFGGDDSIMFARGVGITEATYNKAASMMGLTATSDTVYRDGIGVNFLARYFSPGVWRGCPDSVCDIRRQGTKVHTTTQMDADPVEVLDRKMLSNALTDWNTPIIGDLAQVWCRLRNIPIPNRALDPEMTRVKDISWWAANYDRDVQFPNKPDGDQWMIDYLNIAFPGVDYTGFLQWLERLETVEDFMKSPVWTPIEEIKPHKDEDALIFDGDDVYTVYSQKTVDSWETKGAHVDPVMQNAAGEDQKHDDSHGSGSPERRPRQTTRRKHVAQHAQVSGKAETRKRPQRDAVANTTTPHIARRTSIRQRQSARGSFSGRGRHMLGSKASGPRQESGRPPSVRKDGQA